MSLARRSTHARLLITLLLLIGYVAALRASEPIHVYYRSARKSLADALSARVYRWRISCLPRRSFAKAGISWANIWIVSRRTI